MYAHQVIEDMKQWRRRIVDSPKATLYKDEMNRAIRGVNRSQKFHLGQMDDILSINKSAFGRDVIFVSNAELCKLPYKCVWFDYNSMPQADKDSCAADGIKRYDATQRGALIVDQGDDIVGILFFWKMNNVWYMGHVMYFANVGPKDTIAERFNKSFGHLFAKGFGNGGIWPVPLVAADRFLTLSGWEIQLEEDRGDLSLVHTALMLLNCKNVVAEQVKAPEALNKKRRMKGKQEIFDYHVLNVAVPSRKQTYRESTEPLSHVRVHLCRGHFKEYTKEHPLFGKLTGLYWWQPHVRGQNKEGIVMKDYAIKTKEAI